MLGTKQTHDRLANLAACTRACTRARLATHAPGRPGPTGVEPLAQPGAQQVRKH